MKRFYLWVFVAILLVPSPSEAMTDPMLSTDLGNGSQLEAVLVPKRSFLQGSPRTEPGRSDDETQRQVTLTNAFYLGKYPVTVGQYTQFVKETGYKTEAERGSSGGFGFDGARLVQQKQFNWRHPGFPQTDAHPVTLVSYDDAQAFVRWLAKKSHRDVWLPTEAQWEYACRAGTKMAYYAGETTDDLQDIAWYRTNAGNGTRPVGEKQPNHFGLYDMSGNVYQRCRDWYGRYEGENVKDAEEVRSDRTKPGRRVLRGGSWLKGASACRSAARYRNTPGSRNADNGFRVAISTAVIAEKKDAAQTDSPDQSVVAQTESVPSPETIGNMHSAALGGPTFADSSAAAKEDGSIATTDVTVGDLQVETKAMPPIGRVLGISGLLCPLFVVAGVVIAVILILKALLGQRQSGPREDHPIPQSGEDGFWLDTSKIPPGSKVRYRYRVQGREFNDTTITQPGARQFIYTGGLPTDIMILETALLAAGALHSPTIAPIVPPRSHDQPPPAPSKFGGYPAAY